MIDSMTIRHNGITKNFIVSDVLGDKYIGFIEDQRTDRYRVVEMENGSWFMRFIDSPKPKTRISILKLVNDRLS